MELGYFACEKKLSASEVPGEVMGSDEEDLRCRSLLTVCQRRLGLSEAKDTMLEYTGGFKGGGEESHAPRDARGDEVSPELI